jgi:predicted transcriptional regulator of viral defense system
MTAMMTMESLDTDRARLRGEFVSLPGMCLTVEQAARLLDVPRDLAIAALSALEHEGLLVRCSNGIYRRVSPLLS